MSTPRTLAIAAASGIASTCLTLAVTLAGPSFAADSVNTLSDGTKIITSENASTEPSVTCPDGTVVSGGGLTQNAATPPTAPYAVSAIPFDGLGTGWSGYLTNSAGNSVSARAFAVCRPSGGIFHPITPTRVYDSRNTGGILNAGQTRTVSVSTAVPVNATAITGTLTVTQTQGTGYLSLGPAGVTVATSAINWSSNNLTLATGVTTKVSTNRAVGVGGGGNTHFVLDITGYYQ
jgi:hypothetical protein